MNEPNKPILPILPNKPIKPIKPILPNKPNKPILPILPILLAVALATLSPAFAADAPSGPSVAKDTVIVTVNNNEFNLKGEPADWTPTLALKINGPIADGSRVWTEFSYPAKKSWLKADCDPGTTMDGQTLYTCNFGKNGTRYAGVVDFVVHLSNELAGSELELMRGKAKIGKTPPRVKGQPTSYVYYVDEDWRVPIGFLSMGRTLEIELYVRGRPGQVRPYLFSGGKQVAAPENCGSPNFDPAAFEWWPVKCELFKGDDSIKTLAAGDYEVKVLQNGKLVRTATFKAGADGSFDNGIATASKLGTKRVVFPMKQLVDLAPWDKQAYKTAAFYGNPLTGFAVP